MRIYARATEATIITADEAQAFVQTHHKHGFVKPNGASVAVGLRTKSNELVAVAIFASPRTKGMSRLYTTELLRLAFQTDTRVIGGASKLMSFYKTKCRPSDIFTYQDTTGETTDVYEKAGFNFVKQAKKKQYLVAPGKTLENAERGEYYSIASVVMRGPDSLVGSNLGEMFHADGKRKTNPELFVEELGWHIEETTGDRIYEWFNPDVTFYTYRITATDSDKYYYGVSHVKKANATFADCWNDGYYGSGGGKYTHNKFSNWKKKHQKSLKKEVLATYAHQAKAYEAERVLVGDLHRTDPNCLNSTTGGKDGGLRLQRSLLSSNFKECAIHGLAHHRGDTCLKCQQSSTQNMRDCSVHGTTMHFGETCCRCSTLTSVHQAVCTIHGETVFMGNTCKKCSSAKSFAELECPIHGVTAHRAKVCVKCNNEALVTLKECPIHGEVKHVGETCYSCISNAAKSSKICKIHGKAAFVGDSCLRCALNQAQALKTCPTHGLTIHRGDHCFQCGASSAYADGVCETHGATRFQSGKCAKCRDNSYLTQKLCATHGTSAHKSGACQKCVMAAATVMKECPAHGLTKHRGNSCFKCRSAKMIHTRSHKLEKVTGCHFCEAA
jgi:hypothetical protein